MREDYWGQSTRDRWFFAFFALAALAVLALLSSYLYVLLFAAVAAVVSWPVYERIHRSVGGRASVAAGLTMLALFFLVVGPLGTVAWLFVNEASQVVAEASHFVNSGGIDKLAEDLSSSTPPQVVAAREWAAQWVPEGWLPEEGRIVPMVSDSLRRSSGEVLGSVGAGLPKLLEGAFGFGLDAVIFLFALFTFFVEGPRILKALMHISPMEDRYERQLFDVFRELANNMAIATLVTATVQGIVAGIGFKIAGAPSVVFLAILAGIASFIPFIGTTLVWLPLSLYIAAVHGVGWGLFVVLWNVLFTGTVDNIVKPIFLRGNTQIHPLFIFLAVFGGIGWFGLPGVLIGPLIVAFFLAAYTIYMKEYLEMEFAPQTSGGWVPGFVKRWLSSQPAEPASVAPLPDGVEEAEEVGGADSDGGGSEGADPVEGSLRGE